MDPNISPPQADLPADGAPEPKRSLGNLRNQLETGQGVTPPVDEDAIKENRSQPLANPKIDTPNVGNQP